MESREMYDKGIRYLASRFTPCQDAINVISKMFAVNPQVVSADIYKAKKGEYIRGDY
jgi:hypothetical protein